MTEAEKLIGELVRESASTTRCLERVPVDFLAWRPHEKSMSLGQLAMHLALLPFGIVELIENLETELPDVPLPEAASASDLVPTLERNVLYATDRIRQWQDAGLAREWTLKKDGVTLLQMTRADVLRSILLNHTYHHRGQLSVYLRLLGVPVPAIYGSSADERPLF